MAQASKKTCEICVEASGRYYCVECEQLFCDMCKKHHGRQKSSKNHFFRQETTEDVSDVISKCKDHQEVITLLCIRCNVPTCNSCVTGKHNGHKFTKITEYISKLSDNASFMIKPKLTKVDRYIELLTSGLHDFEEKSNSVIKAIEEDGRKIKAFVDKHVKEMIKSVKDKTQQEATKVNMMLQKMQSDQESIGKLEIRRNDLKKFRPDGDLIEKFKTLEIDIEKLKPSSPSEVYVPSICFTRGIWKEEDVKQFLGTYTLRLVFNITLNKL